MTNRYARPCDRPSCGRMVPSGAGLAIKQNDGSWNTEHIDCEEWAHEHPLPTPVERLAATAPAVEPEVAQGRYAVVDPLDGVLKFYKVDRPTEGRWTGYTFLKVYASDETWPVRERTHKNAVLAAIAADPQGCMERYGVEIGKCGRCGRTLTDETSRSRGIGPDCWAAITSAA